MSKPIHPIALFRLSVLGPLASRGEIKRGEIKSVVRDLASKTYQIPDSPRVHLSEETILRWYYQWKRGGIEALIPCERSDKGATHLPEDVQTALIKAKQDNPSRSINTLLSILKMQGMMAKGKLARATVHRFLRQHALSKRILPDAHTIERRAFVAQHPGDIWHGDVLHGPSIQTPNGMRKTYLVSLLDDTSRLIAHSAFCLGETALDIEGVLKQAVLKRGIPHKIIIDNGPAYRSHTLQCICALLEIKLIYCRPYEPQGKGKLERFHRTFREQFLNEIELDKLSGLGDLNERLWAWLDYVYQRRPHTGLDGQTPLDRWREGLHHVRQLGLRAMKIDDIFCHRVKRTVRKDGTISWGGKLFEVPYQMVGDKIILVVDPHTHTALRIESPFGDDLGAVVLLDAHANLDRKRQRPHHSAVQRKQGENAVELAYHAYSDLCGVPLKDETNQEDK